MALNTIVETGNFTGTGNAITLNFRQGIDWINVYNETEFLATNNDNIQYYWQRGLVQRALIYFKSGGGNNLNAGTLAAAFTEINSSGEPAGAPVATTSSTNAAQPVIATGTTVPLVTGSVVRLDSMANVSNIMGLDFEVDTVNAGVDFRMRFALPAAAGAVGGAGFYRIINFDPQFYPRRRFIVNVTQAASAVIRMSVTHGFTEGQEVRIQMPAAYNMIEFDNIITTITAVSVANNTITVNTNSAAFTAFIFPAPGAVPFTQAQVVPVGADTGVALAGNFDILADATDNQSIIGMILTGGAGFPGGAAADNIFWQAGRSFNNSAI